MLLFNNLIYNSISQRLCYFDLYIFVSISNLLENVLG